MKYRWWILALLGVVIMLFFGFGLERFFTLEMLKERHEELQQAYQAEPFLVISIFSAIYIVLAALSFPGATIMTLAGGAMFGIWIGVPVVLVSATMGATLAFWIARYVLRDTVRHRFVEHLETINKGLKRDGVFYLLSLRLAPVAMTMARVVSVFSLISTDHGETMVALPCNTSTPRCV